MQGMGVDSLMILQFIAFAVLALLGLCCVIAPFVTPHKAR